jgi:hypothetical protein
MKLADEIKLMAGGPGSGPHPGNGSSFKTPFHESVHKQVGKIADNLENQQWPTHAKNFRSMQSDLASGKDFSPEHEATFKTASKDLYTSPNADAKDHKLSDKIDNLHEKITDQANK